MSNIILKVMNSTEKGNIGEEFVNNIAFNSFLKFWCYPGPKDEKGDKKEICDLLILFKNVAIILSVKNYDFKGDYSRYFRNTIDKAVKQINGAERKLFSSNRDVFIKHPDKDLELFSPKDYDKVFRVIVNLGEGVRFYPFNKEFKEEKFITLFDKEAFETIVNELDTIPDFVDYLEKREAVFSNRSVVILPSEEYDFSENDSKQFLEFSEKNLRPDEGKPYVILSGTEHDLLASFLTNVREFPDLLKSDRSNGMLIQLDGNWNEYILSKQTIRKKELDSTSYFIDELVKREVLSSNQPGSTELAKEILSFDRFHRRLIAKNFMEFYDAYRHYKGNNFARRYGDFKTVGVVFAFYPPDMDEKLVNPLLEITIDSFCMRSNYRNSRVILIATTAEFAQFKIGLIDVRPFSKEKENEIEKWVSSLGWFTNHTETYVNEQEYPEE